MKVTLEFNTTDEDFDQQELDRILNASDMCLALWDLKNKVRSWEKYDDRSAIPVDEIFDAFNDTLQKYSIDFERLIR